MQIGALSVRLRVPIGILLSLSSDSNLDPLLRGVLDVGVAISTGNECRLPFRLPLLPLSRRGHDGVSGAAEAGESFSSLIGGVTTTGAPASGELGIFSNPPVLCCLL